MAEWLGKVTKTC